MKNRTAGVPAMAIGVDVGDRYSHVCVFDHTGDKIEESRLPTTQNAFEHRFGGCPPTRVAIEAGTHSPWISRLLKELGHEVIVANPRKLRLIYENDSKNDRVDAEYLARLARLDPTLLAPIEHRGKRTQIDRGTLRARDALVRTRTLLTNTVRGIAKSLGTRLPSCSTDAFAKRVAPAIPKELWPTLSPLLDTIGAVNREIRRYDQSIEKVAGSRYPETAILRQVNGVGPLTALAFVTAIENPRRFKRSRSVASYLGLRPRKSESGASDPQLHITKAGDGHARRLLVQAGHYILGPFGPDSDLRRWGSAIASRGGSSAKKRAVVAVARKLSVLLHRLWVTGEAYDPLRNASRAGST